MTTDPITKCNVKESLNNIIPAMMENGTWNNL